jgi:Lon protease-like protein
MLHDFPDTLIPSSAPVFPLPNLVFFPRTVLPLHIFEERYRRMTAEALATDGCIAMTLMRPDDVPANGGSPLYHEIGCLGKISTSSKTEDGRYYLELAGLKKVELGEVLGSEPYLRARVQPIDEKVPLDEADGSHDELVRLLGACGVLLQEISDSDFPLVSIRQGLPYENVVNSISFHLGIPPKVKQSLLEENDIRSRCQKLTGLVEEHLQKMLLEREIEAEEDDSHLVN